MKKEKKLGKSYKALIAIYELEQVRKHGRRITVEDVAVILWKKYLSEFCMRGYPQYPNVDIQKYITKLLDNNLITGGVYNYKITPKGIEYVKILIPIASKKETIGIEESTIAIREVKTEIKRILSSRVFNYYLGTPTPEFLESDLFEFLGTSSRSLSDRNKNVFLAKYNRIVNDVLPFCEKNKKIDKSAEKIIELWGFLSQKFKEIIERKIK